MKTNELTIIRANTLKCQRDAEDHLVLTVNGETYATGVHLISSFPLSRRSRMVAIRDGEGNELGLIDNIRALDPDSRTVARDELERSYFMPRIKDIVFAEERLGVLTMEVETNRGQRTLQVRNVRRSIRKLARDRVIIKDVDGNRYDVRHWTRLSPYARDILMQYI